MGAFKFLAKAKPTTEAGEKLRIERIRGPSYASRTEKPPDTSIHQLTNKASDWDGLCNFFVSDYFYELPVVKISSQLNAKLVTDSRPIEHGDSMDVKHLSLAIPLAHF